MTRKDYINIAAAILATQTRIEQEFHRARQEGNGVRSMIDIREQQQLRGVRRTAAHLADFLEDDNPRFDQALFLTNCGYGA